MVMSVEREPNADQNVTYCADLMRRLDEDRWLAARYAPAPLQNTLLALGAFRLELRRIPLAVSEPALGEIRLQWWREALDELRAGQRPRAHPVVEALASTDLPQAQYAPRIDGMIDATAHLLYGEAFQSVQNLFEWLHQSDGAAEATAVTAAGGDETLARAVTEAGSAFALAREGAALAPALAGEIVDFAFPIYRTTSPTLAKAAQEFAPALLHLALTPAYLRRRGKAFPLYKRVRLFSAMAFSRY